VCVLPDMLFRGLFIASSTKFILETCTLESAQNAVFTQSFLCGEPTYQKRLKKTMPMAPLSDLAQTIPAARIGKQVPATQGVAEIIQVNVQCTLYCTLYNTVYGVQVRVQV
jgi:hypothetical protein